MACSELVKVNLTIIIIQRITYAFDFTFDCAFDKLNVCGSHSNANANVKACIQMHLHLLKSLVGVLRNLLKPT